MTLRRVLPTLFLGMGLAWVVAGCGGPDPALTATGVDTAAGNKSAADPLLTGTVDMKKQLKATKAAGKASGVPAGMPGMAPPAAGAPDAAPPK